MSTRERQEEARLRRKARIRGRVTGTEERPRLSVYRSANHIYAQIINDQSGTTLAAASTLSKELEGRNGHGGNIEAAKAVGSLIAERAKAANISQVVFDRNGYLYHGRVKALADAARESGLHF
ncbi:MAG: 50S ribosomal protein L18 [Deltaproteobacteria bacterium]|nr:50S ribosomal protein L18 [Deltaproteobacteria bacterium]MBM4390984.1 50S ribosomal protein L18 [Deltaproteobacteria bacterium]